MGGSILQRFQARTADRTPVRKSVPQKPGQAAIKATDVRAKPKPPEAPESGATHTPGAESPEVLQQGAARKPSAFRRYATADNARLAGDMLSLAAMLPTKSQGEHGNRNGERSIGISPETSKRFQRMGTAVSTASFVLPSEPERPGTNPDGTKVEGRTGWKKHVNAGNLQLAVGLLTTLMQVFGKKKD